MKMKFKLLLVVLGMFMLMQLGCTKREGRAIVIKGSITSSPKPGTLIGPFVATGAFNTHGVGEMVVVPNGEDSIHCTYKLTAPEGHFDMIMDCEMPPGMTGVWKITGGSGYYSGMKGHGTLVMMFPPDVPAGVLYEEIMTGEVKPKALKHCLTLKILKLLLLSVMLNTQPLRF